MRNNSKLIEKAEEISHEIYKNQVINKIFNAISNLEQNFSQNQHSWVWDLIQNAKEASVNDEVSIKITLGKGYLEFSHTGKPFTTSDLICLIELTSEKQRLDSDFHEQENNIYRSGGGFSSVFLLSRRFLLKGVWQKNSKRIYKKFSFSINRAVKNRSELHQLLEDDFKIFKRIENENEIRNYEPGEKNDTVFRFELDEQGSKVAEAGLQDLKKYAYFALLFNREIIKIIVNDKVSQNQTEYSLFWKATKLIPQENIEFLKSYDSQRTFFLMKCNNETKPEQIALEVSCENLQEFRLLNNDIEKRIFVGVPIIGIQEFPFPVFVNSPRICLNDQKNMIIKHGNSDEVQSNSRVFASFFHLYRKLINFISTSDRPIFYNLHYLLSPKKTNDFENTLYKDELKKTLSVFHDLPMVETNKSKILRISKCVIPSTNPDYLLEFYDLIQPIHNESMIKKDKKLILHWNNALNSLIVEENKSPIFDEEKLLEFVAKKKSVNNLKKTFEFDNQDEVYIWLNNFYLYLNKAHSEKQYRRILEDHAVIPNENGDLKKFKELSTESSIPIPLVSILRIIENHEFISNKVEIRLKFTNEVEWAIKEIKAFLKNDSIEQERKIAVSLEILSIFPPQKKGKFDLLILIQPFIGVIKLFFPNYIGEKASISQKIFAIWNLAEDIILNEILDRIEINQELSTLVFNLGGDKNLVTSQLLTLYDVLSQHRAHKIINRKIFLSQKKFLTAKEVLKINDVSYKDLRELAFTIKKDEESQFIAESEMKRMFTMDTFQAKSHFSNPLTENTLLSMKISDHHQYNELNQNRKIQVPQMNNENHPPAFNIKKKQEEACLAIKEYIRSLPDYDSSKATYDRNSQNKNILVNLRKKGELITVVARPILNKQFMIHNQREMDELKNPKNELWVSDGENVFPVMNPKLKLGEFMKV